MFYYTHADENVDSSAVSKVYFNKNDGELVVRLNSQDAYQYSGATAEDFRELTTGKSPGTHFATKVKRNLGPGRRIRRVKPDYFASVADLLAGKRTRRPETQHATTLADQTKAKADLLTVDTTVGTPKGLTYATGAKVTGSVQSDKIRVTLGDGSIGEIQTNTPEEVKRKHTIRFVIPGGGNEVRSYSVEATGVGEAVKELQKATTALGLIITVKEVTVYFE